MLKKPKIFKYDKLVIIAMPLLGLPAGGFIRAHKVLHHLHDILQDHDIQIELYTPPSLILNTLLRYDKEESYKVLDIIVKDLKHFLPKYNIFNTFFDYMIKYIIQEYEKYFKLISNNIKQKIINFPSIYLDRINRIEKYFTKKYLYRIKKPFAIYTMNENIEAIISTKYFALGSKAPVSIMLQLPPYPEITPNKVFTKFNIKYISTFSLSRNIKKIYDKIAQENLHLLMAVSPTPFLESPSILEVIKRNNVRVYIPKPSNAYDKELINYRSTRKDPCLVTYFGRLTPFKGLYDLLYIWKIIERNVSCAKLQIIGKFDKYIYKYNFFNLVKKLELKNIEYLGYIPKRSRLYQIVSRASILLYPSYHDSFSLTVLESIALGLVVAAYDIPAIRYIYSGLPNVFTVPRGDIKRLASVIIDILKQDKALELVNNSKVIEFLRLYGSWNNVARAEARALLRVLRKS